MKSIRTKIVAIIGGLVILTMIVSGVIVINTTKSTVMSGDKFIARESNSRITSDVNNYFTKYITMVQQIARDENVVALLSSSGSREAGLNSPYFQPVLEMLTNTTNSDPDNILSLYPASISAPLAFDGSGWIADEDFDLSIRNYWFTDQKDIDAGYIVSEPYKDEADTGLMVMTISAPVYDPTGSRIVGTAAVDIQITTVNEMVTNAVTPYETGYQTMISAEGTVLANINDDKVLKPYDSIGFSGEMLAEIQNPSKDVFLFTDEDTPSYAVVGEADYSGWKIINIIPEQEFLKSVTSTTRTVATIYILSLIILIAVLIVTARNIVAPLKKLTAATSELAQGNLDAQINVYGKDEVGQLASAMRSLSTRLHAYIDYIAEISVALDEFGKGNLTLNLQQAYDGEFQTIKEALLRTSSTFRETIGNMVQIATRVANGSAQVANGSQILAQGTTEQASSIEELSATIQDISMNVNKNAENALSAADQVKVVGEAADKSNEQMRHMLDAIELINIKSSEIGKIIKTIDDIAFQTNILALNAAVEAARAGAAGKGFAVVADEVRNLASKSADAAKTTTQLIEDSIHAVENGTKIANETSQVLSEVLSGVTETVTAIQQISNASNSQAASLSQTLQGVDQISSVVQSNSATAEESSAASEELSSQAAMLQQLSGRFSL